MVTIIIDAISSTFSLGNLSSLDPLQEKQRAGAAVLATLLLQLSRERMKSLF
ncbi:hypothetical protein KDA_73250 [Dictyobacter alpinus]|uniref:Uncharacterized protein n=1 Tax=Dictyobacter alpinus TaxID=2014873 RepID=A0A402BKH6_9CHLR|nr:hypothetical protein KDA_73250 [Dictyobacter alpinus]